MSSLAVLIADVLARDAARIAARWQAQVRFVAPRLADSPEEIDLGERPPAERADAERLVRAIIDALRGDALAYDTLIRVGWDAGTAAHGAGLSLHYLLKELDLLTAMMLYAAQCAVTDGAVDVGSGQDGVAAGFDVARRLQRGFSLLTLSATKGFAHAYAGRLQEEYRELRHELRNPLGTIKGAIALMEDERVAPELRDGPRFRGMVLRNAASIDTLVAERLSDASAVAPEFGRREVSLRDIALSVRRDLRDEIREKGCELVVGESLPTALVDPAGFELALKSAVIAALHLAPRRSAVAVTLGEQRERSAVVTVAYEPEADRPRRPPVPSHAFVRELLENSGGRVWTEEARVCLEVPTVSRRHSAHDVAGAGQRYDL